MRLIIAVLVLSVCPPLMKAASKKGECKNRCDSSYQFCLNRSTTKQAKKACKLDRKTCKRTCK